MAIYNLMLSIDGKLTNLKLIDWNDDKIVFKDLQF